MLDTKIGILERFKRRESHHLKRINPTCEDNIERLKSFMPNFFKRVRYQVTEIEIDETRNILYALLVGDDDGKST